MEICSQSKKHKYQITNQNQIAMVALTFIVERYKTHAYRWISRTECPIYICFFNCTSEHVESSRDPCGSNHIRDRSQMRFDTF